MKAQDHKAYPQITGAAVAMAACNGGLNRATPLELLHDRLDAVLGAEGVYANDLQAIEVWLATLTDDQLLTLVDGEETEMQALMAQGPAQTAGLLDDIWNGVV